MTNPLQNICQYSSVCNLYSINDRKCVLDHERYKIADCYDFRQFRQKEIENKKTEDAVKND
jgi:hypothetical protein